MEMGEETGTKGDQEETIDKGESDICVGLKE